MSSLSSQSPARLTSLATQTLTLVLERQRLQSTSSKEPSPQIKRNFRQLHSGILAIEEATGRNTKATELREQYERMRGMLGGWNDTVESLAESEPEPSTEQDEPSPQNFSPYRDDPGALERGDGTIGPPTPGPDPPYSDGEAYQMNQQMMDDQDSRLDTLSHSINRQRDISLQINDELDTHHSLLEGLDTDLDRTEGRLTKARKQLDRFSRGMKGNGATIAIGLLITLLLILIVIFKTS